MKPSKVKNDTRKSAWVPPTVKDAGTVSEILKGGGGKLSIFQSDTGDVRKPKGQG